MAMGGKSMGKLVLQIKSIVFIIFLCTWSRLAFAAEALQMETAQSEKVQTIVVTSVDELEEAIRLHKNSSYLIKIQLSEELANILAAEIYDKSDQTFLHRHTKGLLSNGVFFAMLGGVSAGWMVVNRPYDAPHPVIPVIGGFLGGLVIYAGTKSLQTVFSIMQATIKLPAAAVPEIYQKWKRIRAFNAKQQEIR